MPPLPRSREALSLVRLADYLEAETQPYEPLISWRHYKHYHDSTLPPLGFIETPKGNPLEQYNYDLLPEATYYNLVLKVSHVDMIECVLLTHDWRSLLMQKVMRKLKKEGTQEATDKAPFFRGMDLVEWTINPDINQDEGATTILRMLYRWDDVGLETGLRMGNSFI